MTEIMISIKKKPINFLLILIVAALYLTNNLVLKRVENPTFRYFFICHFNDLICPLLLLGYSNILLLTIGMELKKYTHIFLFCLAASFVWEFVAPIVKKSSVTDWYDILSYLIGGTLYWIILRVHFFLTKRKEEQYDRSSEY